MALSFFIILFLSFSGLAVTYLFAKEENFLWRLAAGSIIGSAIYGLVGFVIACFFGLNAATSSIALLIALLPLILLTKNEYRRNFRRDWKAAVNKTNGVNSRIFRRLAYYAFFFLLFVFFFDRAMLEMRDGIYTGGSHNLGDLPFHLGAIFSFTEGNNFPPQNPSFSGAKFSYPFIADFLTACFMKLGAGLKDAMYVQNLFWAFSLLIVLERFVFKLTSDRFAAKIAPALLFFSGGFGFLWLFYDFWHGNQAFSAFLGNFPYDTTINTDFRWGNSLTTLFLTQRSFLIGMPLTIVVLQKLWETFIDGFWERKGEKETGRKGDREKGRKGDREAENFENTVAASKNNLKNDSKNKSNRPAENPEISSSPFLPVSSSPRLPFSLSPFLVGLLAGMLPLIHLHSLAVLFVVTGFLFFFRIEKWREWIAFGVGVSLVAVPELIWSMSGSASRTSEFIGLHFGWDKKEDENFIWFWLRNTGFFIPILLFGIYWVWEKTNRDEGSGTREEGQENRNQIGDNRNKQFGEAIGEFRKANGEKIPANREKIAADRKTAPSQAFKSSNLLPRPLSLLLFYLPFAFLFFISNVIKMAPWQWDNVKVLIYWFIGSIPFVALVLAWMWRKDAIMKLIAAACFAVLILAGALDVYRVVSQQISMQVFERDAVEIAEHIKKRTAPDALFLNAPTYNSAAVLTGRRSFMRFTGHLTSHGIDITERENDLKRIYEGDATADILLRKNGIEYVLITPRERDYMLEKGSAVNEEFFTKYPLLVQVGQYKVYKVK